MAEQNSTKLNKLLNNKLVWINSIILHLPFKKIKERIPLLVLVFVSALIPVSAKLEVMTQLNDSRLCASSAMNYLGGGWLNSDSKMIWEIFSGFRPWCFLFLGLWKRLDSMSGGLFSDTSWIERPGLGSKPPELKDRPICVHVCWR